MKIVVRYLFRDAYAETWYDKVSHVFLNRDFLCITLKKSRGIKRLCARDVFSYSLVDEDDNVKHTFFIHPLADGGYEISHE